MAHPDPLRRTLVDERSAWLVCIQETLFHHGIGGVPDQLRGRGRALLSELELPDAARERIEVGLAMIDAPDRQLPRSSATSERWPAASRAAGSRCATTASDR